MVGVHDEFIMGIPPRRIQAVFELAKYDGMNNQASVSSDLAATIYLCGFVAAAAMLRLAPEYMMAWSQQMPELPELGERIYRAWIASNPIEVPA